MCTGFEMVGPTRLITGFENRYASARNRRFVRANSCAILAIFATSCQKKQAAQNDGCFHAHAPLAWLP
jgi:hypothetical protein